MQPSPSDNSDSPDDSIIDPNAGPFPRYLTNSEILAAAKPDIVTNDPIDLGFSTFNALFDAYIRPYTRIDELDSPE
jgi:hypothetical protein